MRSRRRTLAPALAPGVLAVSGLRGLDELGTRPRSWVAPGAPGGPPPRSPGPPVRQNSPAGALWRPSPGSVASMSWASAYAPGPLLGLLAVFCCGRVAFCRLASLGGSGAKRAAFGAADPGRLAAGVRFPGVGFELLGPGSVGRFLPRQGDCRPAGERRPTSWCSSSLPAAGVSSSRLRAWSEPGSLPRIRKPAVSGGLRWWHSWCRSRGRLTVAPRTGAGSPRSSHALCRCAQGPPQPDSSTPLC